MSLNAGKCLSPNIAPQCATMYHFVSKLTWKTCVTVYVSQFAIMCKNVSCRNCHYGHFGKIIVALYRVVIIKITTCNNQTQYAVTNYKHICVVRHSKQYNIIAIWHDFRWLVTWDNMTWRQTTVRSRINNIEIILATIPTKNLFCNHWPEAVARCLFGTTSHRIRHHQPPYNDDLHTARDFHRCTDLPASLHWPYGIAALASWRPRFQLCNSKNTDIYL